MPTEAVKNRLDALVAVAGAASTLVVLTFGYVLNHSAQRLDDLERAQHHSELSQIRADSHQTEHNKTSLHWIGEITVQRKLLGEHEKRLSRLESQPSARPDSFTGTDGRRLETLIKILEKSTHTHD